MSRRRLILLAGVSLLAVYGAVFVLRQKPLAVVATGYMARVACACHFIAGRPLDACYNDGEAGMELVRLAADPARRRITASIPLLATADATHTPGLGCVLER